VLGDTVRLNIAIGREATTCRAAADAQSSMAVARMLLELQGATLTDCRSHDGSRRLTASLPLACERPYATSAILAGARLHRTGTLGATIP
jgi:hypothetical protein